MLRSGYGSLADLNAMLKPRVSVIEGQHSYMARYVIQTSTSENEQISLTL
jgi:hypothetical protein